MSRPSLAITMGEPAGIGAELLGLAWLARETAGLPSFYCLADPSFLADRLNISAISAPVCTIAAPEDAESAFVAGIPVIPLENTVTDKRVGKPSTENAAAVLESIECAVDSVLGAKSRAVVTPPVQKETLYDAGFSFPGHTEFLGDLATRRGHAARPVMMLASDELRVVPVTIHVPLARVPELLTMDVIVDTGRIVADELKTRFDIENPRLAVCGLNPHAGESGRMGVEDRDIIAPAVKRLAEMGITVSGPYAADTLFHPAAREKYDAAIAMYHDQGLIPIKTIAFDSAVNITLGLPFVRTSPDHGTALGIAGTGQARPSSFIAAIRMADQLSKHLQ